VAPEDCAWVRRLVALSARQQAAVDGGGGVPERVRRVVDGLGVVAENYTRASSTGNGAGGVAETAPRSTYDDLLTADQAATLLRRTSRRVRQYRAAGDLAGELIGREWHFRRADVVALAGELNA
jgi:hypothetical protein